MTITMLKAKIHRATVTEAKLDYVGSITIDSKLMEEAGIYEYEKVQVVNIANGKRFETYTIKGEAGSGIICLNGAAALCGKKDDKVIIMSYCDVTPEEAKELKPTVVFVDNDNKISRIANYEKYGRLEDQE
jgi:aspartate 1-decarboxylase